MRYIYFLIAAFIFSISPLMADKRSEKILDEMSLAIDGFGGYEVRFLIDNGGDVVVDGSYVVDGDIYKLLIANQEIYGDGEERFTVDNGLKEVVKETIDSSVSMIVANPARAFSNLKKGFDSEIITIDGVENICMMLKPRNEGDMLDSILLELDSKMKLPLSVVYRSSGEIITVRILEFEKSTISLTPLKDMKLPEGYDIIDIR